MWLACACGHGWPGAAAVAVGAAGGARHVRPLGRPQGEVCSRGLRGRPWAEPTGLSSRASGGPRPPPATLDQTRPGRPRLADGATGTSASRTHFFPSWACRCTSWSPSTAWWKSNTAGSGQTEGHSRPRCPACARPRAGVAQLKSGLRPHQLTCDRESPGLSVPICHGDSDPDLAPAPPSEAMQEGRGGDTRPGAAGGADTYRGGHGRR